MRRTARRRRRHRRSGGATPRPPRSAHSAIDMEHSMEHSMEHGIRRLRRLFAVIDAIEDGLVSAGDSKPASGPRASSTEEAEKQGRRLRMATPEPHISAASGVLIRCYCSGGSPRQAPCVIQATMHYSGTMRHLGIVGLVTFLLSTSIGPAAHAEFRGAGAPRIEWEVKNRFRLFRNEADFQRHVAATRNDGVLGAEQRLARESDGRGWARDTVERLCVDRAGKLLEFCDRDGEREDLSFAARPSHRRRARRDRAGRMVAAPGASTTAMARRGRSTPPATRR